MYQRETREIYRRLKQSAKRRGIKFELTLTDINNLTFPITCPILNIPLKWNQHKAQDNSYSFDRIDSSKGYSIDNIIVISLKANILKNSSSPTQLKALSDFYNDSSIFP